MTHLVGLPAATAERKTMLPVDALAGSRALIVGAGFAAATIARGLAAAGAEVQTVAVDIDDMAALQKVVAQSGAEILVNATATPPAERAEALGFSGWRAIVGRSLDAAFAATAAFADARGRRGGVVLNVIDIMSFTGGPGVAASAASQAALINLGQSLAVEWAARDIRVNAIAVGQFEGREGPLDARTLPAMRLGQPRELEWAAAYLCSAYAAYITGATFTIDGGDSLRRTLLEAPYSEDEFL